jgi:choline dehydrogenase-like flavoprotein
MITDETVVIIGSGAGGGAAAWALTHAGIQVVLLEAGPAFSPEKDYFLHKPNWEASYFPEKPGSQRKQTYAPLQVLDKNYAHLRSWNHLKGMTNTGDQRRADKYSHVCGVGGSTLHFTGESHRFHPGAMKLQQHFQVGADWPLTYDDLQPFYQQAETIIGVSGSNTAHSGRPRSKPYPLPAHEISYASQVLGAGMKKLNYSWQPNSLVALSRPYDDRPGCNYCGQCQRGCPRRDKGTVDVTFIHQAMKTGYLTILKNCAVTQLVAGKHDRIEALHYRDAEGQEQTIRTPRVVVACGAVETPRLLLASDGLANEQGQVGRHFMETLSWVSTGLHPQRMDGHRGLPADAICWDFNAPDAIPGVVGGCRFASSLIESDIAGPASYAKRVVGGWGHQHHEKMRSQFGHALSIGAVGEFLPNDKTYIDLDPEQRDEYNMPLARIHSHLQKTDLQRLDFMAKTCRKILLAAGIEKMVEEYGTYDYFSTTHVFGTCRMGDNEKTSVVNKNCRSHRWQNLYIMDASIFPSTGGGESPSLTIEALALRACGQF